MTDHILLLKAPLSVFLTLKYLSDGTLEIFSVYCTVNNH